MKLKSLLLVLMALAAGTAGYRLRLSHAPCGPRLECAEEIDFGPREYGETATSPLTITNTGDQLLHLDEIRSDCSCSGLEQESEGGYAKVERLTVHPGESVRLVTRLVIRGSMGGPERHSIRFRTNDPRQPEGRVGLFVPLVKGIFFYPNTLLFGDLLPGTRSEQILTIRHEGVGSFTVDRVVVSDPSVLTAELLSPVEGTTKSLDSRVRVVVAPARSGPVDGSVTAYFRRAGVEMSASVLVSARCVEAFTAQPSRLLLPKRSQVGLVYQATLLCRSHSGNTFSVTTEECPEDLLVQVEPDQSTLGTRLVRVSWKAVGEKHRPGKYTVVLVATEEGRATRLPVHVECETLETKP